jgi:hypothetical protein
MSQLNCRAYRPPFEIELLDGWYRTRKSRRENMARSRVEKLLETYFNRLLKEYQMMLASLRTSGGLNSEEMNLLK